MIANSNIWNEFLIQDTSIPCRFTIEHFGNGLSRRKRWALSYEQLANRTGQLSTALTGTPWPDLLVALLMAGLFSWSALQIIRQSLELDGFTVIVVQKRDLDDPQAVRLHLRNIAQAMGRDDLANED